MTDSEVFGVSGLEPRRQIPVNTLLRAGGPTMPLDQVLGACKQARQMREAAAQGQLPSDMPDPDDLLRNLAEIPESTIQYVHSAYGAPGLFQLLGLASSSNPGMFKHFFSVVEPEARFRAFQDAIAGQPVPLACDNDQLPASTGAEAFAFNVIQPSLSRKLYRSGTHHGSVVYGLGGPRMLVSHPFEGVSHETTTSTCTRSTL